MTKIEETLAADAQAWCRGIDEPGAGSVNIAPVARILNETTQYGGSVLVRAVMYFQLWEWPQSGSGWGDYYFRAVEVIFMNGAKTGERLLRKHQIHVTEYEDETFDWQGALTEFSKAFE